MVTEDGSEKYLIEIIVASANGLKLKKEVWDSGSLICEKYYAGSFVYILILNRFTK